VRPDFGRHPAVSRAAIWCLTAVGTWLSLRAADNRWWRVRPSPHLGVSSIVAWIYFLTRPYLPFDELVERTSEFLPGCTFDRLIGGMTGGANVQVPTGLYFDRLIGGMDLFLTWLYLPLATGGMESVPHPTVFFHSIGRLVTWTSSSPGRIFYRPSGGGDVQ
jgi:hypothetical protein